MSTVNLRPKTITNYKVVLPKLYNLLKNSELVNINLFCKENQVINSLGTLLVKLKYLAKINYTWKWVGEYPNDRVVMEILSELLMYNESKRKVRTSKSLIPLTKTDRTYETDYIILKKKYDKLKGKLGLFEAWMGDDVYLVNDGLDNYDLKKVFTSFFRYEEMMGKGYIIIDLINYDKKRTLTFNEITQKFHYEGDVNGTYLKSALTRGFKINSIKSLNTGETLKVGDFVTSLNDDEDDNGIIIAFENLSEGLNALVEWDGTERPIYENLDDLVVSKKLFTTLDGVDINVGDEYYYLTRNQFSGNYNAPYHCTNAEVEQLTSVNFSNKDLAKEYQILANFMGDSFDPEEFKQKRIVE